MFWRHAYLSVSQFILNLHWYGYISEEDTIHEMDIAHEECFSSGAETNASAYRETKINQLREKYPSVQASKKHPPTQ